MTLIRGHMLRLAAVALAALTLPGIGAGAIYPSRPVRIILALRRAARPTSSPGYSVTSSSSRWDSR